MKNTTILFLIILLSVSGCTYYKAVQLKEVTKESLIQVSNYKPIVLISNGDNTVPYRISKLWITSDTIKGFLTPQTTYPADLYYVNSVKKSQLPEASNILHLRSNIPLSEGYAKIALNNLAYGSVFEKDVSKSAIGTAGVVLAAAGVAAGGVLIFLIIACNCPHVAILNPDGTESFQGSLFPGSMFKMLARTDNLVLSDYQKVENGEMEIKVYNELEEVQYIDNVQLIGVNHNFEYLGLNNESQLIAFNPGEKPVAASSQNGMDVLDALAKRDEVDYKFDEVGTDDALNSVEFTFNTESLKSNAQLVIRAQQSKWLEQTAEVFFQQFGTYFPKWVDEMNSGDVEKYNQNAVNQGISLNAYAKQNGKWEYIGSYQNVGTVAKRDIALPIDLSKYGNQVEIKLECAHAFWDVDQITLTSEWTTDLNTTSFNLSSAINEKGEDVYASIALIDQEYVTQAQKGTYTNLKFEIPENFEGSLVLNGSGYYNHTRDYEQKPNRKFLKEMKNTELSTHQLSRVISMYSQLKLAANN